MVQDFRCGFQPNLSSGTLSRVRRVLLAYNWNSSSKAWTELIGKSSAGLWLNSCWRQGASMGYSLSSNQTALAVK